MRVVGIGLVNVLRWSADGREHQARREGESENRTPRRPHVAMIMVVS
jgi:hypothetical protein